MVKSRALSKHSRAARRATSPGINTDKSLKDVDLPSSTAVGIPSSARPSILAVHGSAGVQKKSKPVRKGRLSAKARRRHERGLEMAEAVTERTGKKIKRSFERARNIQSRAKTWEEVNRVAEEAEEGGRALQRNAFAALDDDEHGGQEEDGDDKGWATDEDSSGSTSKAAVDAQSLPVSGVPIPAGRDDDDDEIL